MPTGIHKRTEAAYECLSLHHFELWMRFSPVIMNNMDVIVLLLHSKLIRKISKEY